MSITQPSTIPDASLLFEPVRDGYGRRLALVLGNEFKDGKCPFYAKQCIHCDIGAGEGIEFNFKANRRRLKFFHRHYSQLLPHVAHLVIYNSGSTLNEKEMCNDTLDEVLRFASSLAACRIVSFDSREAFIRQERLERIVSRLGPGQQLRIILGLESQNDEIRIDNLQKRMDRRAIESAFDHVGAFDGTVGIDVNIVFQPPGVTGREAVREAVKTAEYGLQLSDLYNVPVDFNIHPFYPSARSIKIFPHHPRASINDTLQALAAISEFVKRQNDASMVFVGWQDEEHDQQQDTRKRELDSVQELFDEFNASQDAAVVSLP